IGGLLLSREEIEQLFRSCQRIGFSELAIENQEASVHLLHIKDTSKIDEDFDVQLAGKGRISMAPLAEKLSEWLSLGARV
ncbi:MAG: hypothetical protein QGG48_05630, partial [Desulfatiglandales bacterium]|nr:hypothetical protein [Desulfatiglandales bacterium]